MSAAQNSLLELKIAAINHLEYEDYMILLGEVPDGFRARYNIYTLLIYCPKKPTMWYQGAKGGERACNLIKYGLLESEMLAIIKRS